MMIRQLVLLVLFFPSLVIANGNNILEEIDYKTIKDEADLVIKRCGYDKGEIYNLYVATLDSLNTIHGPSRDNLNSNIKTVLSTNNKNTCSEIKTDAGHIVAYYKATLKNDQ